MPQSASNIGILLGWVSAGLMAIDIDNDSHVQPFLELNPQLPKTTRTRAEKGCQLFIVLKENSPYPNTQAYYPLLTSDGASWGEWRCGAFDGAQSIVYGVHPKGMRYQLVVDTPPLEVDFSTIRWPSIVRLPWLKDEPEQKPKPESTPKPKPKSAKAEPGGDRKLREEKEASAEQKREEELAAKMEAQARRVADGIDAYYDLVRKEYPLRDGNAIYQSLNEGQFKRVLRFRRLRADLIPRRFWSQLDIVIRQLQQHRPLLRNWFDDLWRRGDEEGNPVFHIVTAIAPR